MEIVQTKIYHVHGDMFWKQIRAPTKIFVPQYVAIVQDYRDKIMTRYKVELEYDGTAGDEEVRVLIDKGGVNIRTFVTDASC